MRTLSKLRHSSTQCRASCTGRLPSAATGGQHMHERSARGTRRPRVAGMRRRCTARSWEPVRKRVKLCTWCHDSLGVDKCGAMLQCSPSAGRSVANQLWYVHKVTPADGALRGSSDKPPHAAAWWCARHAAMHAATSRSSWGRLISCVRGTSAGQTCATRATSCRTHAPCRSVSELCEL